ncbi:hypothetical protein ACFY12_07055 [Streptomyces sp. NPDC001339]|uniref:hypothetical protein n=1 Tax=Streptomyces sp. NPDC001339 TaxID=3364563 RepID=UPI0036853D93
MADEEIDRGPVADFCEELRCLVRAAGLRQNQIARTLAKSEAAVSDLLRGRIKQPPAWNDVREIVARCGTEKGLKGTALDRELHGWHRRLAKLEDVVEGLQRYGGPATRNPTVAGRSTEGTYPSGPGVPPPPFTMDPAELTRLPEYEWPQALVFLIHVGGRHIDKLTSLLGEQTNRAVTEPLDFAHRLYALCRAVLADFPAQAVGADRLTRTAVGSVVGHVVRLMVLLKVTLGLDVGLCDGSAVEPNAGGSEGCAETRNEEVADAREDDHTKLRALAASILVEDLFRPRPSAPAPSRGTGIGDSASATALREGCRRSLPAALDRPGAPTREVMARLVAEAYARELHRLATEGGCPELALQPGSPQPPKMLTDDSSPGLRGLGSLMADSAAGGPQRAPLDGAAAAVARLALAAAHRPVAAIPRRLGMPGSDAEPVVPVLEDAYINPAFRAVTMISSARPEHDDWWLEQPLGPDLQQYLATHLTAPQAVLRPLLVLGHPGAGKSLLCRLLAARLPNCDFLPVTVELRTVDADAHLQQQIEQALERATGEPTTWPELVRSAPGRLPLLLLDGFDELLQASTASHWSYLQHIAEFQEREAALGRPVAVLVTSRTVVTDRAEIPNGTPVVRLESFDDARIERWLATWNAANATFFAQNATSPLAAETVLRHRDLARQPLLLLLLALYEATTGALSHAEANGLSQVQLYEELLCSFVRRQVRKAHHREPLPEEVAAETERELERLSVVALGMINRSVQSVRAEDVRSDTCALHGPDGLDMSESGQFFGRFFFVHEAQAVLADTTYRAFEFLHATFGEYLAARRVMLALREALEGGVAEPDDGLLYALLSFAPLTDREQVLPNVEALIAGGPPDFRDRVMALLKDLFRTALTDRPTRTHLPYTPRPRTIPGRLACYSANLVLLCYQLAGEQGIHFSDLTKADNPVEEWRSLTALWQSQLTDVSWKALCRHVGVARVWRQEREERRDVLLTKRKQHFPERKELRRLNWALDLGEQATASSIPARADIASMWKRITFRCDRDLDVLFHTAWPVLNEYEVDTVVVPEGDADATFAGATLRRLHLDAQLETGSLSERVALYRQAAAALEDIGDFGDSLHASRYLCQVLGILRKETPRIPAKTVLSILDRLSPEFRDPEFIPGVATPLMECVIAQRGRPGADRNQMTELLERFAKISDGNYYDDCWAELRRLLLLAAWDAPPYRKPTREQLDGVMSRLDLEEVAEDEPALLAGLIQLAFDSGLHEWVQEHERQLLHALEPDALALLRPHHRAALLPSTADTELADTTRN